MEIKITTEELQKRKLFVGTPMYGGACLGLYARSMIDLGVLCARYGVELQVHYLFNESLIQRARNYITDEFIRSKCTHMLFIDADIGFNPNDVITMLALMTDESEYDVLGGPYPKKCLHHKNTVITPDGDRYIGELVREKYTGKVLSLNADNKPVWANVTEHWAEPNKHNKRWVSLQTAVHSLNTTKNKHPRGCAVVTEDHEIAYVSDVFNPRVEYTRADNMANKYIVKTPKLTNSSNSNDRNSLLNSEQLSVLIGAALGDDGRVTNGGYVCNHNHGNAQLEYNTYKHSIIGGQLNTLKNIHRFKNGQTKHLADILYEGKQKTLKNVINYIDASALAIMYMDGGNRYYYPTPNTTAETEKARWYTEETVKQLNKPNVNYHQDIRNSNDSSTANLATMSLTLDDNLLLVKHIKDKFNIECFVYKQGKHFGIKFDRENTTKLHALVAPYVPACMEYKLNDSFRGGVKVNINNTPLEIAACKVYSVNTYEDKSNSQLFDIEVEGNHNFFCNDGVLVHNCISWEKVKQAVDQGVADEDPNILDNFVGDYVFNTVTPGPMALDKPAEVLETGTGFMMMRRRAFDLFKEKFGDQVSYLPDHARSANFSGDREIVAYFDCVIEPTTKRYLSEDYYWCQKVREAGGKVWLCPWMQLKHVGSYIFGGSLSALAEIGAAASVDPSKVKPK